MKRKAFCLLAATQLLIIAAITIISIPLPYIAADFRTDETGLEILNATYGLSFGALLIFSSLLNNLYRPLIIYRFALAGLFISSLMCAFSSSLSLLIMARFMQGSSAAFLAPACSVLLHQIFTKNKEEYNRVITIWGTLASLGATLGFILSGILLSLNDWRMGFLLMACLALLLCLGSFSLQSSKPNYATNPTIRRDMITASVITAILLSLGLLILAMNADHYLFSITLFIVLVVLSALFVSVLKNIPARKYILLNLTRNRIYSLLSIFLISGCMATFFFSMSLNLQGNLNFNALELSATFTLFAISILISSLTGRYILTAIGFLPMVIAGFFIAVSGSLSVLLSTLNPLFLYIGVILFPYGAALVFSACTYCVLKDLDQSNTAYYSGALNVAMELGPSIVFIFIVGLARMLTLSDSVILIHNHYDMQMAIIAVTLAILFAIGSITLLRTPKSI